MVRRRSNKRAAVIAALTLACCTSAPVDAADCGIDSVSGFTEPAARIEVAAREPGIVAMVHVKPGDRVKAGELLAELDKTIALAEVGGARVAAQAKGRIAAAEARKDHADRRMTEFEKLEKSRAVRPMEVLAARAELQIAEAELLIAREDRQVAALALERAQSRLSLLDIRAPFNGLIETVHREVSELVGSAGDARIVTLLILDTLFSDLFLPAECFDNVSVGDPVEVYLPSHGLTVPARVRDLGAEVDAPTGLRRLGLKIENPDYELLAGERLVFKLPEREISH